jgi:hypothetical protein
MLAFPNYVTFQGKSASMGSINDVILPSTMGKPLAYLCRQYFDACV